MSRQSAGAGAWSRSFSIFSPSYARLPAEDENGDTAEKPDASRHTAWSQLSARLPTILRYSPIIIIPIFVLLAVLFAPRPTFDSARSTDPSTDTTTDTVTYTSANKTHALSLKPVPFDPEQPFRKALVLASFSRQHVEWLSEINDEYVTSIMTICA